MQRAASGAVPFDMRPTGYDSEEALAFLGAISPQGRAFYLGPQQWLDTSYPLLLALTLASAILWLAPPSWRRWRLALAAIALPVAAFDWLENARVAVLLEASDVAPAMIAAASQATVMKSLATSLVVTLVIVLALAAGWRARKAS